MKSIRLKRATALLVLISLIFQSNTYAKITPDLTALTNLNVKELIDNPASMTPEEEEEARNFLRLPTQYTLEIMYLLKNLYTKMLEEEEKNGSEAVLKTLKNGKKSESAGVQFENGVGNAEPLVLDLGKNKEPVIITKVRHNALKMTILFVDKNQIDMNTLSEFETLDKQKRLFLFPPFRKLSNQEIKIEAKYYRHFISKLRILWARTLMKENNLQIENKPLFDPNKNSKVNTDNTTEENNNNNIVEDVTEATESPIEEIQKKPWFKKIADQAYSTWVDYAKEYDLEADKTLANKSVLTVFYDGKTNAISERFDQKLPAKTTFEYWKIYWRAIWEPPAYNKELLESELKFDKIKIIATGDYLLGWGFAFALGGLSYLVATLLPQSLPHGLQPWQVGSISFGWTLFFGVFSKTYQNFVYRGNSFARFLKNWSVGMAQSYHYNLVSHQSLSIINSIGKLDLSAIKSHTDIIINQSIKSASKTSLQEVYRYRAKKGEASGTLKIPYFKFIAPSKDNNYLEFEVVQNSFDLLKYARNIAQLFSIEPFKEKNWEKYFRFTIPDIQIRFPWIQNAEWDTHIPNTSFEGQKPQLLTTPVGLLSRFGYTIYGLPLGHILYALLGPFGEIQQTRYKTAYALAIEEIYGSDHELTKRVQEDAAQAREQWRSFSQYKVRTLSSVFSGDKEYYEFRIPGSQFIGYYATKIQNMGQALQKLSNWIVKKTASVSYNYVNNKKNQTEKQPELCTTIFVLE